MKSLFRKINMRMVFSLMILFCVILPHCTLAANSNAACFTMTPSLTNAAFAYLDEIYTQKYPEMARRIRYGTTEDKDNLKKLADQITKDSGTNSKKVNDVITWCLNNIECNQGSTAYPQEVFYNREGNSMGLAGLMVDLLRLEGIPAVTAQGWRGDMKKLTYNRLFNDHYEEHAWFLVYLDGKWVMFDPLFSGIEPITDRDQMASLYYFNTIEGISVTYAGMDLSLTGHFAYVYKDGRFMNMINGKPDTGNMNNSVMFLSMCATPYSEYCGYEYMDPSRTTANMIEGELFHGGWFSYSSSSKEYAYENGIIAHATVLSYQGKDYYFNQGESFRILAPAGSYWIQNEMFTVSPGFSQKALLPSFVEEYTDNPEYSITYKASDAGTEGTGKVGNDGTFTALAPGVFSIEYQVMRKEDEALMSDGYISINVSSVKPVPDYSSRTPDKAPDAGPDDSSDKSKPDQKSKKTRLKAGKTFADSSSNGKYKVLKGGLTVEFVKMVKSKASLSIPASVKKDGFSYKVVSIAAGACKGNKKLKSLKIAGNISKIGKKAFYGCSNLTSVTIRTKKLKASTVGEQAFGKGSKKVKVKVPKNSVKSYTKLLIKKGLNKKAAIKKI